MSATQYPDPFAEGTVDLRQYLVVLKRHRRPIVIVTAACLLLAAAYTFMRPPIYTSKASISLKPTGMNLAEASDYEKAIVPENETALVLSTSVASIAQERLGVDTGIPELIDQVRVNVPPDSQILEISFSDPDPERSQQGALAFANAYLDFREDQAQSDVDRRSMSLAADLAAMKGQGEALNETILRTPPNSIEHQNALFELGQLEFSIQSLRARLVALDDINVVPGTIIGVPGVPVRPSSPNHPLDLTLGLFFGLLLGVGIAFFRTRTDQRLHERLELEQVVGAPVLSVVPKDIGWSYRNSPRLVTVQQPRSPTAEAYRTLRPTLLVAAAQRDIKTIMITSPTAEEGKTTTVANLGVVMAQADRRVMIISADLRKPRVHEFFGVPNERGLADVLQGKLPPMDAVRRSGVENLWLCPSGPNPTQPAELLQSHAMKELLAEQRSLVDFILIDCPPILAVADALGLAPMVDGVLLVAHAGSTTADAAEEARERLNQVGARVVGCVLNDLDLATATSYYGYGYGDEQPQPNGNLGEVAPRRGRPSS